MVCVDCFVCVPVFALSQPLFVDCINKKTHVQRGSCRRKKNVACISRKQWYYSVYNHTKQSKSNQTPRKEKCLQEDAQRGGEHRRAIVLRKGKKKKKGRRKRGVKREKAFLHLHCTTGGLHAIFTRRLCEFEITWVTETLFHPLFFAVFVRVVLTLPVLALLHLFCVPCVTASSPPSLVL